MNLFQKKRLPALALLCLLLAASLALAGPMPPHADWVIGRNDQNQLLIHGDENILSGAAPILLEPGDGIFDGLFVKDEPGWESALADEPPELYQLLPNSRVALKRLAFTSGFAMYDPFTASEILAADNDLFEFPLDGPDQFHIDLVYSGLGPAGQFYSATYQLVDLAGLQTPSELFTFRFETVPEPASLTLLGLSAILMIQRPRIR